MWVVPHAEIGYTNTDTISYYSFHADRTKQVNPLSPADAYLHQTIECAKGPLTHICVKGEGMRFILSFGSCKWDMPMSMSRITPVWKNNWFTGNVYRCVRFWIAWRENMVCLPWYKRCPNVGHFHNRPPVHQHFLAAVLPTVLFRLPCLHRRRLLQRTSSDVNIADFFYF